MFKLITTLIFINNLQTIFTINQSNGNKLITIPKYSVEAKTEKQAAQLFVKIESKDALPLVLFEKPKRTQPETYSLRFPKDIEKAVILNGRMVEGTEFSMLNLGYQMFYCPKPDSEETCLVPQIFEKSTLLKCSNEPIPAVQKNTGHGSLCGPGNIDSIFSAYYDICSSKEKYSADDTAIYEFCYTENRRKTLYSYHIILNPKLLKSNLLFRERQVPYPFIDNDEFRPLNFEGMDEELKHIELNTLIHPKKPSYKIQKLVPDTDMAFALWRKTTYLKINLDWQHETLIPLWNKINQYIKSTAIQLDELNAGTHVHTAVVEIDPTFQDDTQMFNIWIKMVTTQPLSPLTRGQGVAILMNNFISPSSTADDSETSPNIGEKSMDEFCGEKVDYCASKLREKFQNVKGQVRCCPLTEQIKAIFDTQKIYVGMQILHIPGITSSRKIKLDVDPVQN